MLWKEHTDIMEAARPKPQGGGPRARRHRVENSRNTTSAVSRKGYGINRQKQLNMRLPHYGITECDKGAWRMPRLSEAKKDVTSCDKPRRGANTL